MLIVVKNLGDTVGSKCFTYLWLLEINQVRKKQRYEAEPKLSNMIDLKSKSFRQHHKLQGGMSCESIVVFKPHPLTVTMVTKCTYYY